MAGLYRDAGVNLDAGNDAVRRIKTLVRQTYNPQVLGDVGNFGGLYAFPNEAFNQPILVSSTDGVGTKLKVAFALKKYDTVGIDLVNHCVNDILVQGAKPLFFLDYIGTGSLQPEQIEAVVRGLVQGCSSHSCVLIGGETAEMPGIYGVGEFDLVGTIIGVVERELLVTGATIAPGDLVLGLPSAGLHTNGYSLARHICFEKLGLSPATYLPELKNSIGLELLQPHRSYFTQVYPLVAKGLVKGLVHITGGGFYDNIPRILPTGCGVKIKPGTWPVLPIFEWLQRVANIPREEAYHVFNMGLGLLIICSPNTLSEIQATLPESYLVGQVVPGAKTVEIL